MIVSFLISLHLLCGICNTRKYPYAASGKSLEILRGVCVCVCVCLGEGGGGGIQKLKFSKCTDINLNLKFQRCGRFQWKHPSMGGIWIFFLE